MALEQESRASAFLGTILAAIIKFGLLGGIVGFVWGWATGFNPWVCAIVIAAIAAIVLSFMSLSIAIQKSEQRRREYSFARDMMFTPLFFVAAVVGLIVGCITQVVL